jgi:hypothetical protein
MTQTTMMASSAPFAIITAYYKEDRSVLERCVRGVKSQSVFSDHFLVSDGFPQSWLDDSHVRHIKLGKAHKDAGNTPRGLGALLAVSEGYTGIGFLDADNWYDPNHVEECCRASEGLDSPVDIVFAKRRMFLANGVLINAPEQIDHVDTRCCWFLPGSFHLLHYWTIMPRGIGEAFGDRIFYNMIKVSSLKVGQTNEVTVNYTSNWEDDYRRLGFVPPTTAKRSDIGPILAQLKELNSYQQELLRRRCGFDVLKLRMTFPVTNVRNSPCFCGSGKRFKHCHGAS